MITEIIKGIIAVVIVLAAIIGLFFPELNAVAAKTLLTLAGAIIGYYFGVGTVPFGAVFKKQS